MAPAILNASTVAAIQACFDINMNAIGYLTIYLIAPTGEEVLISGGILHHHSESNSAKALRAMPGAPP
ncbi:hypothetical protein NO989_19355 [Alteromonas sp. DY56-G5]|uniref:hypothetical protein n=1 Tax=Alteromonas sp. DY56-G5 TaxID=2967128 RepID=UPI00352AFAE6